jgi:hypothetical protein
VADLKGEVITCDCRYDSLDPVMGESGKSLGWYPPHPVQAGFRQVC